MSEPGRVAERRGETGGSQDHSEAVLLHTPTGRDAELIASAFESAGLVVNIHGAVEPFCHEMTAGAGVGVIAEEALSDEAVRCVVDAVQEQPSWSDFPLIVLTSGSSRRLPSQELDRLRMYGNVSLLERPVHPVTLLSAVQTALRARRRQYQVRDYLVERERAEERVRQAQKMDAVGKLAGGVAHEVNNMMTAVIGFGEFALKRLGPNDPTRSDVTEMVNAGRRAASITQQLLAFSRRQHHQPTVLRLQEVVPELGKLLSRLLGAEYGLEIRIPDTLSATRADRTQLEQVIVNLVLNARDAMTPGNRIIISAEMAYLDRRYALGHPGVEVREGRYVMLVVSDTGRGMDAETRRRAFEPFFTTKPIGQGTGLGLSTVYGIVKQSGGYIWLYSELGLGTTIKIYLPETVEAVEAESAPLAPRRGRERILIVEDEDIVRRLARLTLEEQGYAVLETCDGEDALATLARVEGQVDLVLCDVVMPRMNGRELGRQAQRLYPSLPFLYMSGYTGQDVVDRGLLDADAPLISKPFSPQYLAQRVREFLDQQPPLPRGDRPALPSLKTR